MGNPFAAVAAGTGVMVVMVAFWFVTTIRAGRMSISSALRFLLPSLGLLLLLWVVFLSGPAVALIAPPIVIAALGGAMIVMPRQVQRGGISSRTLGWGAVAVGVILLAGNIVRLVGGR